MIKEGVILKKHRPIVSNVTLLGNESVSLVLLVPELWRRSSKGKSVERGWTLEACIFKGLAAEL